MLPTAVHFPLDPGEHASDERLYRIAAALAALLMLLTIAV